MRSRRWVQMAFFISASILAVVPAFMRIRQRGGLEGAWFGGEKDDCYWWCCSRLSALIALQSAGRLACGEDQGYDDKALKQI
ncbi:hypothetical protein GUJ93_ZPchr0004g39340 [Zizania palustris]|uniref:Uncharacterized protein n=1 Tax=Zizania palustris TaxID=103762 RepID=A0A8J5VPA8_ZIZPA|nr:hypothetical protein GUJ93_ZPchr0004g39340 [Zizania palustris]